jgi:hypothetical protein
MKKLISVFVLSAGLGSCAVPAFAQHHHHHGYWRHGGGNGWVWVAPTIIGGVIGYEIARNQPPVVVQQQPPVVIQQPPVVVQPSLNCSPWTEVQNPDGTVTRTRTCQQ